MHLMIHRHESCKFHNDKYTKESLISSNPFTSSSSLPLETNVAWVEVEVGVKVKCLLLVTYLYGGSGWSPPKVSSLEVEHPPILTLPSLLTLSAHCHPTPTTQVPSPWQVFTLHWAVVLITSNEMVFVSGVWSMCFTYSLRL